MFFSIVKLLLHEVKNVLQQLLILELRHVSKQCLLFPPPLALILQNKLIYACTFFWLHFTFNSLKLIIYSIHNRISIKASNLSCLQKMGIDKINVMMRSLSINWFYIILLFLLACFQNLFGCGGKQLIEWKTSDHYLS